MSQAARHLGITSQGLLLALRRLSDEVGAPLADVRNGEVAPTAYGELFLRFAETVDEARKTFEAEAEAMRAHDRNVVRLGCVEGFVGYIGEWTLATAAEQGLVPEVMACEEHGESELEAMLLNGAYGLAVLSFPSSPVLVRHLFSSAPYYIWARRQDPLAQKESVGPGDLDGRRVAVLGSDERWAGPLAARIESMGEGVELVPLYELMRIYEYACSGKAIGLTTRNHVVALGGGPVAAVPIQGMSHRYYLCHRSDHALSEGESRLLAFLEETCGKISDGPAKG